MKVNQPIQIQHYQHPVDLINIAKHGKSETATNANKTSFKDMFSHELAESKQLSFSKHAQQRLFSRGVELSDEKLSKIVDAVDRADSKGSKETLVLTEDVALVVSVENRTVITAFDRDNLRDGIVTSIDSAVVL
ncbi:MAG: TIGR02530 family flagellar biosynthesis protein [candidate division Zixibacteria bacterium]|nr:TIGR02530 family flagellar biosynthesis protein [candidate division Zixibacteria bacterium]